MKTLQVSEFKSKFSEVLEAIRGGQEVTITNGKKKEKIAVFVPFSKYSKKAKRKLGLLEGKASFSISKNFKISEDELLQS